MYLKFKNKTDCKTVIGNRDCGTRNATHLVNFTKINCIIGKKQEQTLFSPK